MVHTLALRHIGILVVVILQYQYTALPHYGLIVIPIYRHVMPLAIVALFAYIRQAPLAAVAVGVDGYDRLVVLYCFLGLQYAFGYTLWMLEFILPPEICGIRGFHLGRERLRVAHRMILTIRAFLVGRPIDSERSFVCLGSHHHHARAAEHERITLVNCSHNAPQGHPIEGVPTMCIVYLRIIHRP